jgi:hypothetical protein
MIGMGNSAIRQCCVVGDNFKSSTDHCLWRDTVQDNQLLVKLSCPSARQLVSLAAVVPICQTTSVTAQTNITWYRVHRFSNNLEATSEF